MKVTLLLADSAQVAEGKLYILGGGWNITGPQPTPMAIALLISVPWVETNKRHRAVVTLVDGDGLPFLVTTPLGTHEPFRIQADFEVGRPLGIPPGSDLNVAVAVNVVPLALRPGATYEWRLSIDDRTVDTSVSFVTRELPQTV